MKKFLPLAFLFLFCPPPTGNAAPTANNLPAPEAVQGVSAPNEKVRKLASGFSFTEGPAVNTRGDVYFTDQPNDRIWIWSIEGKLSCFREKSGRANGLYFDNDGALLSCSDADNELWRIEKTGKHSVLAAKFKGEDLNGPNDLWVHPSGGIYFTDPFYARPYWRDTGRKPRKDGEHVYYLPPNRKTFSRVEASLNKPNGIIGTPDGRLLYVADIGAGKTYRFDIKADGSLANKQLFVEMGSDGMTIDAEGNVYLTGKGVTVFNPRGRLIEQIPVPAPWTANVCFGGTDGKTLFITASQGLYALRMRVRGGGLPTK
ncbi:MAG: SMP-30/gluconolactonase/LRE family protein [Puniceicoccales bacterium]|nr:SMP-30/gluconolactonase/LRE family protein [Puniceicoccales bacterium]